MWTHLEANIDPSPNELRFYIANLNAIDTLNELTQLHLNVDRECSWKQILDLVERLPNLEKLQLSSTCNRLPFHLNLYQHFVNICRLRGGKKLIISIDKCDRGQYHIPDDVIWLKFNVSAMPKNDCRLKKII